MELKKAAAFLFAAATALSCAGQAFAFEGEVLYRGRASLSDAYAVSLIASYNNTPEEKAEAALDAARKKAGEKNAPLTLLSRHIEPEAVYLQQDIGGGLIVEAGAVAAVTRQDGRLRFTGVLAPYSRAVSQGLSWSVSGTPQVTQNAESLEFTVRGTASISAADWELFDMGEPSKAGFSVSASGGYYKDATVTGKVTLPNVYPISGMYYQKDLTLTGMSDPTHPSTLSEADIAAAYAAIPALYEQADKRSLPSDASFVFDIQNPVGLTARAQALFLSKVKEQYSAGSVSLGTGQPRNGYLFRVRYPVLKDNMLHFQLACYTPYGVTNINSCVLEKKESGWVMYSTGGQIP